MWERPRQGGPPVAPYLYRWRYALRLAALLVTVEVASGEGFMRRRTSGGHVEVTNASQGGSDVIEGNASQVGSDVIEGKSSTRIGTTAVKGLPTVAI